MVHRSRRALAALTSAAAIAAGIIGTAGTGSAQAATAPVIGSGAIAFHGTDGSVQLINPDGSGQRALSSLPVNPGATLSWSGDGSRLAEGGFGTITTVRPNNTMPVTFTSSTRVTTQQDVFAGGSWMVSEAGGTLYRQLSDGWDYPVRLMTATQEPAGTCDTEPAYSWGHGVYAFVRGCSSSAMAVWTFNENTGALKLIAANADQPSFSADGGTLVYRTGAAGSQQVVAVNVDGTNSRVLTTDAAGVSSPSLSPDGTKLVYGSVDGTSGTSIVKLVDLAKATTVTLANGTTPVWQPLRNNYVDRVYGTGGVTTDAAASRWEFNTVGRSTLGLANAYGAVLVNRTDALDAAVGIELAGEKQAPLLMTSGASLDSATSAELRRSVHRGYTVYLDGSTSVLSSHLAAQVAALGFKVVRVGSAAGSAQSVAVARLLASNTPQFVFVADSQDYRTAASAAAAAGAAGYHGRTVVVLNNGWTLPSTVSSYLNTLNPAKVSMAAIGSRSIYALEHSRAISPNWRFWTFAGTDPEAVSAHLASWWWGAPQQVTLADTNDWAGSMAGAAANVQWGPLLWTSASKLDGVDQVYLLNESASVGDVQLFGTSWYSAIVPQIGAFTAANSSWSLQRFDPNGTLPAGAAVGVPHAAARPALAQPTQPAQGFAASR